MGIFQAELATHAVSERWFVWCCKTRVVTVRSHSPKLQDSPDPFPLFVFILWLMLSRGNCAVQVIQGSSRRHSSTHSIQHPLPGKLKGIADQQTENRALLQSIYNTADRLNSRSSSHQYDSSQDTEDDDEVIYNNDSDDESASSGRKGRNEITGTLGALGFDDHTWLSGLSFFSVGGMVAFLLWSGTRRWRASRRGKGVKVY